MYFDDILFFLGKMLFRNKYCRNLIFWVLEKDRFIFIFFNFFDNKEIILLIIVSIN